MLKTMGVSYGLIHTFQQQLLAFELAVPVIYRPLKLVLSLKFVLAELTFVFRKAAYQNLYPAERDSTVHCRSPQHNSCQIDREVHDQ